MLEILLYALFITIFFAMFATLHIFILKNISYLILNTHFNEGLRRSAWVFSSSVFFVLSCRNGLTKHTFLWKWLFKAMPHLNVH